jgi:hypothetical protein
MPSIDWNKRVWGQSYEWPQAGGEWSAAWGGADMQWYRTILPRIHVFLPVETVLEIAPGHGRWTQYLKGLCQRLLVVDLSASCIDVCRRRFAAAPHIEYFVNDGKSLDMIPDHAVDFAFSFDSLVHAEHDVIEAYLQQLGKKINPNGIGFIHHSNLGAYQPGKPGQWGPHGRAWTVTAAKVAAYATEAGLQCIGQETINWGKSQRKPLIDCLSLITPAGSRWARPNQVVANPHFWGEVEETGRMAGLYGSTSFRR